MDKLSIFGIFISILFLATSFIIESISYFASESKFSPPQLGIIFLLLGLITILIALIIGKKDRLF